MDSSKQNGSEIARMIWIVGPPIIFTVGVFGNIMTIIVLTSKLNKKTSSSIFLTFLAMADLLIMTIMLPRWWLIYMFGFDVRHIHNIVCKFHFFINYFATGYSASLLAAVTIERIICTVIPYKVKTICTTQIAVIISLTLAITLCVIHGHVLVGIQLYDIDFIEKSEKGNDSFTADVNGNSINACENILDKLFSTENDLDKFLLEANCGSPFNSSAEGLSYYQPIDIVSPAEATERRTLHVCWSYDEGYLNYFSGVHQIVATVCYLIIPETIFFLGGFIIARSLQKSRKLRMRMSTKYTRASAYKATVDNRATQITLTLLLVNLVFVFTTSPAYIFLMGMSSWVDEDTGMTEIQEIIWAIVNVMIYINHSINFILYFLSGYRFRRQVLETFNCMKTLSVARETAVSSNHNGTASISSNYDLTLK